MKEQLKYLRPSGPVIFANGVFGGFSVLVLRPLIGQTYDTIFCCLIGLIAGYGVARSQMWGGSKPLLAMLCVLSAVVFFLSLRMHQAVAAGDLTKCDTTLLCSSYLSLLWAFTLYVSIGFFASIAGIKLSSLIQ